MLNLVVPPITRGVKLLSSTNLGTFLCEWKRYKKGTKSAQISKIYTFKIYLTKHTQ